MPAKPKTQEVAVRDDGSLPLGAVLEMIRDGQKIRLLEPEADNEALRLEILDRTLGASTAEELFSEGDLTSSKDFVGLPFELRAVRFRNSDDQYLEGGVGIYAILEGVTLSGEMVTLSASGENIVVKAIKALQLDALPRWVKITSDTTSKGYEVLNLVGVKAPKTEAPAAGEEPF